MFRCFDKMSEKDADWMPPKHRQYPKYPILTQERWQVWIIQKYLAAINFKMSEKDADLRTTPIRCLRKSTPTHKNEQLYCLQSAHHPITPGLVSETVLSWTCQSLTIVKCAAAEACRMYWWIDGAPRTSYSFRDGKHLGKCLALSVWWTTTQCSTIGFRSSVSVEMFRCSDVLIRCLRKTPTGFPKNIFNIR